MLSPKHRLSIIVPAYNEEKTIESVLEKIVGVDLLPLDVEKEIVIVDDGSRDKTADRIKEFKSTHPNLSIKIVQKKNGGKGTAIRAGIPHTTGDIIIIQDADLEYDPNDYGKLIVPILSGAEEVVYGSRRLNRENVQYSGLSFYLGGLLLTVLTNVLYGTRLTDEPTCYKVFRANILKDIELTCERFEFCPEVTAKVARAGIRIHEVPISYYPRSVAEGKKIRWIDGIEGIWTLFRHRMYFPTISRMFQRLTSFRPVRFILSGGTAAVIHVGVVYILSHVFDIWYRYATVIGFFAALAVGFLLQKFFTFNDTCMGKVPIQSSFYLLITSFNNLFLNTILMYVFVDQVGLAPAVAQILTALILAPVSYILYSIVFRTKRN